MTKLLYVGLGVLVWIGVASWSAMADEAAPPDGPCTCRVGVTLEASATPDAAGKCQIVSCVKSAACHAMDIEMTPGVGMTGFRDGTWERQSVPCSKSASN